MALLQVKLKDTDASALSKRFGHHVGGRIDYKAALAALTINLQSATPLDDYWLFRDNSVPSGKSPIGGGTESTTTMRDFLQSKVEEHSSYREHMPYPTDRYMQAAILSN